jgi:hypothetical protein
MDRDLGKLNKSFASTMECAGQAQLSPGLRMKQSSDACQHTTRTAASSKAHDNDGTFSKEFHK